MQPHVELNGISKRWNDTIGVERLSLSIDQGSFVALLGPSGCGKSTSLRLLAAMVFQSYALFPHLSVAENVVFGLKVRRVPKRERMEKMARALSITGLEGLEKRKPGELSGGQRQRVALARAIVAGQKLCLMDEPLSNLDAKLRNSVRKDIKKLQRDLGITVVYVTHDQTEAMSMADKVVLMKDGRLQQVGSPNELYSSPANTFVAGFIGAPPMALIESQVLPEYEDGLTLGLRAEHVSIVPNGTGRLSCEVIESEFVGAETLIGLAYSGTVGVTVLQPGLSMIQPGERVDITFNDRDLHRFNQAGERL